MKKIRTARQFRLEKRKREALAALRRGRKKGFLRKNGVWVPIERRPVTVSEVVEAES